MAKKTTRFIPSTAKLLSHVLAILLLYMETSAGSGPASPFPGVSRDLATFCAARPSLPIDLASMVVHVKKNVMFNYKLYLFSQQHVFQTGQVIPRDDFRIHSFPVKLKKLHEFWPESVATQRYMRNESGQFELIDSQQPFDLAAFMAPVPIEPHETELNDEVKTTRRATRSEQPFGESFSLPGDDSDELATGSNLRDDLNSAIEFDRDDQVSVARLGAYVSTHQAHHVEQPNVTEASSTSRHHLSRSTSTSVVPVGSFSSFHVNTTYLVRKDFGQEEPELIKILVDAQQFQVRQLTLISDGHQSSYLSDDDYAFLKHKLLRDANTRITSISQIYEDWITRNLYTLVYIQRKLEQQDATGSTFVTDRLIFRGTSSALLGADQLDYPIKATAFITEKNGLHYYLEFLPTNKFYLCAIDWTKRPFKIIDSRQFPIKATRTQLDNEELLLCPPSVCHSSNPLDEVIAYGRLSDVTNRTSLRRSARRDLDIRLHLRDWHWSLDKPSASQDNITSNSVSRPLANTNDNSNNKNAFGWHYEQARRNEIKAKQDNYGYALTGHQIDASYRLNNELYLVSANHLITINYTLANETATSSHLIGDEFPGLSSTLLEPITGAFYDRATNQIYFFKGDRYIGFDYATKRPLEEFQLQAPTAAGVLIEPQMLLAAPITQQQLVSSLPVVGILGRQHEVDGVYHDLPTDLVYIFSGMNYYTFKADEFKNGSFVPHRRSLPTMLCINEHFLQGCHFDEAFPNTCSSTFTTLKGVTQAVAAPSTVQPTTKSPQRLSIKPLDDENKRKQDEQFRLEQQMKLRSIAAGQQSTARLLSRLLAAPAVDPLLSSGRLAVGEPTTRLTTREGQKQSNRGELELEEELPSFSPSLVGISDGHRSGRGRAEADRVVIYLLVSMVGMTVLITVVMIVVIINWTKAAHKNSAVAASAARQLRLASLPANHHDTLSNMSHLYLRNQEEERRRRAFHHHQQQQQQQQQLLHSKTISSKAPVVSVVSLKTNAPTAELVDSSIL